MTGLSSAVVRSVQALMLVGTVALAGCASTGSSVMGSGTGVTAGDPTRLTESGFLSDYARLEAVPWDSSIQCWRAPELDISSYDRVMIARMTVTLLASQQEGIDPTDLKTLTDYFHDSLVRALEPQMPVVDEAGLGVIVLRIALTDLVPTSVSRSVTGTLIPYAFVAEAGSGAATGRPAGATPYLGETGMEMQFLDGATRNILAECRDTQIGRKYAADLDAGAVGAAQTWASGYLGSFESWSYARNAFDKWSVLTAKRLAELRGVEAPE
jgi:hypothetical protein